MFDTSQLGPLYEDFTVGAMLPPLPPITLTEADNTLYRAVTGDQHLLAADRTIAASVAAAPNGLANPGLCLLYTSPSPRDKF